MNRRRLLIRTCKRHGFVVQPMALQAMMTDLGHAPQDVLETVLMYLAEKQKQQRGGAVGGVLSKALWQSTLQEWMASQPTQTPLTPTQSQNDDEDDDAANDDDNVNDAQEEFDRSKRQRIIRRVDRHNSTNGSAASSSGTATRKPVLQVLGASETPKWTYDRLRHTYDCQSTKRSPSTSVLLGSSKDKLDMMTHRYMLVQQRVLAHDKARTDWFRTLNFSRPYASAPSSSSNYKWTITSIDRLLGSASREANNDSETSTVVLLGLLTRSHSSHDDYHGTMWMLQDITGTVPLDLSHAHVISDDTSGKNTSGGWIPELYMVLVHGRYGQDDVFYVDAMAPPPPPLPLAQPAASLMGERKRLNPVEDDGSLALVVCSHVQLDQPQVVSNLKQVLLDYDLKPRTELRRLVLVLMGPFVDASSSLSWSSANSSSSSMAAALDDLAHLMEAYPKVSKYAHVVLVPSLEDHSVTGGGTSGLLFPQPPIRASLSPRLKQVCANLSLTTNPGRITTRSGQQVVLFNHAGLSPQYFIPQQQRQEAHEAASTGVWLPSSSSKSKDDDSMEEDGDASTTTVQEQQQRILCRTMLEQGHLLAPLLSSSWSSSSHPPAVYWNLDHALRLDGPPTPGGTPTCVVLGLQSHDVPFVQKVGDCQVLCPGSLLPAEDNVIAASKRKTSSSKRAGQEDAMDVDNDEMRGNGWYSTIHLPGHGHRNRASTSSIRGNKSTTEPQVEFHKLFDLKLDGDDEDDNGDEGHVTRQ